MSRNEDDAFPSTRLEGAPSDDIGWHFAIPVEGNRNNVQCKLCSKIIKGGITRLKQHIAHYKGQVAGCPNVRGETRQRMMQVLMDSKAKKIDSKKRKEEFEAHLRGEAEEDDIDDFNDDQMRRTTQESIRSQREWENRERFRHQTGGHRNVYDQGGSSHASVSGNDVELNLRSTDIDLERSLSAKQQSVKSRGFMKTLRQKLGKAVSKFIIYERLPMNLTRSPWLHNLITTASDVGKGVKCPTPYQVSEVYLEQEYQSMKTWINSLKSTWKERGVTIMCDGWTDGISHTHIMNFLVYCYKGTIFFKSVDASNEACRNTDYYFKLLDKVVEEVGEEYVVQVVTDNEKALKAAGQRLMEKRPYLYWSACAAHCLDLCLEDIGKKKNVEKVLNEAKTITTFIYNHIWLINLMKKYTGGREIVRPGVTRFATQFLQLQALIDQKQGLRNMFNSEEFKKSKFWKGKHGPALEVCKIVVENDFWAKASDTLKVFEPIVRVLRLVDGDEKPTMGFIYEAVDRAKLAIQQNTRYYSKYHDIIDKRWRFMHSDLHSAGYFLNPQFQYGIEHGIDVYKETFEGTRNVISKLERSIEDQIKALNQLMLFKDRFETFGTHQAQLAWSSMNPADWWFTYGTSTPELQRVAIKVLSQTTSATNCERNWSAFSYIHTKTRNRLKYKKLQKLVFTYYNMKLKMRHQMRRSQEEIEASYNPINLDYIFHEEDPLSPWVEERENPLLDGIQNTEWFPIDDSDDEAMEAPAGGDDTNSNQNSGEGLSPPSNNSGNSGGNIQVDQSGDGNDEEDERRQNDPYQEEPYSRRDGNLIIDATSRPSAASFNRRSESSSKRGKRKQKVTWEDSSSSNIEQSFSNFGINDSSQSSKGYYPPPYSFYQNPHYGYEHGQEEVSSQPPYYIQPPTNYQDQYYQQSGGYFDYMFGQGATHGITQNDSQNETGDYDLPRHSTMW